MVEVKVTELLPEMIPVALLLITMVGVNGGLTVTVLFTDVAEQPAALNTFTK